ncbi:putative GTP cyclohydrolase 1 type 2 [Phycisphaerae bacterium RAS1]|nr:putative GTP cyclohydrolase 1 type 2 [Phycisphaerae bacterium RAS1]
MKKKAARRIGSSTAPARTDAAVADLEAALNRIAPFKLAAEWDNVGLLAGRPEWPARRILLAIDLTDAVAREAIRTETDALVLYHPPIFKGIRSVTPRAECPTTLLPDLLAGRVALLAVHTAMDAAVGGTNDVLLDAFDPAERLPLTPAVERESEYKLVVFVPPAGVERLRAALAAAGAGRIGHYDECSFELAGRGSFRGDETTNPTIGQRGRLEHVAEIRLEMILPKSRLGGVVRCLYANHPYEEPAFDLYPLAGIPGRGQVGMGRIGRLARPRRGDKLLLALSKRVDLSAATVVGDLNRTFGSVTTAAGAFGVSFFTDPHSLVLTGEFKHHDALELLKRGVCAVCLGHYTSERPVLDAVRARLTADLSGAEVRIAKADAPPLRPLPTSIFR